MNSMFYDVPCVNTVSPKSGKMLYAIFDDPFEAMSFAHRERYHHGLGWNLKVNRRVWHPAVFERSWIRDYRQSPVCELRPIDPDGPA